METTYLVLKDTDGVLRPMAFCSVNDEAGKIRANLYKDNMEHGDKIVVVEMKEIDPKH